DIDLVVGGSAGAGSSCSVLDNTIWHGGKFAFAGLNVGNFSPGNGIHSGANFSGNSIKNTTISQIHVIDPDAGINEDRLVPSLGIGLLVGSHPWRFGHVYELRDAGNIGPSGAISGRPDISTGANHIAGANVNLLVEGVLSRASDADSGSPVPGNVHENDPAQPPALPSGWKSYYCENLHAYVVNEHHALMTHYDTGYHYRSYDGFAAACRLP